MLEWRDVWKTVKYRHSDKKTEIVGVVGRLKTMEVPPLRQLEVNVILCAYCYELNVNE